MITGFNFRLELLPRVNEWRHTTLSVRCRKRTPTFFERLTFHLIVVKMARISHRFICSPARFHFQPEISLQCHNLPGTLALSRKYLCTNRSFARRKSKTLGDQTKYRTRFCCWASSLIRWSHEHEAKVACFSWSGSINDFLELQTLGQP